MTTTTALKYMPERPATLTGDWLAARFGELHSRIAEAEAATTADQWIELAEDWNALKAYAGGEHARISHEFAKDMANAESEEKERANREGVTPELE
ncbi:MAG: hypothetical protein OSB10_10405, partial [Planctomycetota bacterium]|nr:hypothetical protein [Planctomycetota bacterium]